MYSHVHETRNTVLSQRLDSRPTKRRFQPVLMQLRLRLCNSRRYRSAVLHLYIVVSLSYFTARSIVINYKSQ